MKKDELFNFCFPEPMSGCWLWTKGVKDEKHPYGVSHKAIEHIREGRNLA